MVGRRIKVVLQPKIDIGKFKSEKHQDRHYAGYEQPALTSQEWRCRDDG
jgi:hypothetical protein